MHIRLLHKPCMLLLPSAPSLRLHVCEVPIPHGLRRPTQGLSGAPSAVRTMWYSHQNGHTCFHFLPASSASIRTILRPDQYCSLAASFGSTHPCCYKPCMSLSLSTPCGDISQTPRLRGPHSSRSPKTHLMPPGSSLGRSHHARSPPRWSHLRSFSSYSECHHTDRSKSGPRW